MAFTPPTTPIAEWASDGAADLADPGATKRGTGFEPGDVTDFNSTLNYVLNRLTAWARHTHRATAPLIAYENMEYTEEQPFGYGLDAIRLSWDQNADVYYASCMDTGTGPLKAYDSDDGVTWSASRQVEATGPTLTNRFTRPVSNGTVVGMAADASFYLGTTLDVSTISTTPAGTFLSIDYVHDLIYDDSEGRWFACGEDSGALSGFIESSADGITWVLEHTGADPLYVIASDNAGNAVAGSEVAITNHYTSDMQGTWNTTVVDPIRPFAQIQWVAGLNSFVGVSDERRIYWSTTGGIWLKAGAQAEALMFTPDFVMFTLEEGSVTRLQAITNLSETDTLRGHVNNIGTARKRQSFYDPLQDCWYSCKTGRVIWLHTTEGEGIEGYKVATANYGKFS